MNEHDKDYVRGSINEKLATMAGEKDKAVTVDVPEVADHFLGVVYTVNKYVKLLLTKTHGLFFGNLWS